MRWMMHTQEGLFLNLLLMVPVISTPLVLNLTVRTPLRSCTLSQTTEDCFNMDYRYPLSLLQAFAICIARWGSFVFC